MTPKFAQKISDVINNIGIITKDKTNPFYKSQYTDINSMIPVIKEELEKAGITCMTIVHNNSLINVFIDQETGDTFPKLQNDSIGLQLKGLKPQEIGSEITFFRRYLLTANLLVEQQDEDGNKSSDAYNKTMINIKPLKDKYKNDLQAFKEKVAPQVTGQQLLNIEKACFSDPTSKIISVLVQSLSSVEHIIASS